MKKISILFLSFIFALELSAQNNRSHSFGIQINPYAKSTSDYGWNAALRYTKTYKERFSWGIEVFGNTYSNPSYYRYLGGLSLLLRYNVVNNQKARYFVEGAFFNSVGNWRFKKYMSEYSTNYPYLQSSGGFVTIFDYYIAPGIQIPFAQGKFSIDLILKASTNNVAFDAWKLIPSYRLNFHF